jgi:hypothetical protein
LRWKRGGRHAKVLFNNYPSSIPPPGKAHVLNG